MTIETSELNASPALPASNDSLKGGSGDGNSFVLADLQRGYTDVTGELASPYDRIAADILVAPLLGLL